MRYIDADKIEYEEMLYPRGDGNYEECQIAYRDQIDDIQTADVVEGDKAQKEIDYWHDKAQSYEQTILKLSLNKSDVVEVVRCKDCKWRDTIPRFNVFLSNGCRWHEAESPDDDDYCSYGERADT